MRPPCGVGHPDHPGLTCGLRESPVDHEEHWGHHPTHGNMEWPNPEYQPKVHAAGPRRLHELADEINRETRELLHQPGTSGAPLLPDIPVDGTLRYSQQRLMEGLEEGVNCACCGQFAKIYKRSLSKSAARCLLVLYVEAGEGWAHLPTVLSEKAPELATTGGYAALAGHWGLMEESDRVRDDGGRAGWWRVTASGVRFLSGEISIPKYVRLYNGRVLDHTGDAITMAMALGEPFDLRNVMSPGGP